MTTIVKKISVATVFGRIKAETIAALKESGEYKVVGRFYGVANAVKTGVSQYGAWTALIGTFRGVNAETGEVFDGSQLLLPMGLVQAPAAALANGADSVSLAFDIKIKHREIAGQDKYEYSAEPVDVGGVKIPSPLDALESAIGNKPLGIAHTKSEPQPTTEEKQQAGKVKK